MNCFVVNFMTKIAIFDLDGTIDKGDTFLSFITRNFLKSPKRWKHLPNLILGYFSFIFNPNFVGLDLKLLFLEKIIKKWMYDNAIP